MKHISGIVLGIILFPLLASAAPLTTKQATSLIDVVQSSTSTPASAFVPLITSFSNITTNQAISLINVVQASPSVPDYMFINLLQAFTVDTIPVSTQQPASTPTVQDTPVQTAPVQQSTQTLGKATPSCSDTPNFSVKAQELIQQPNLHMVMQPGYFSPPYTIATTTELQFTVAATSTCPHIFLIDEISPSQKQQNHYDSPSDTDGQSFYFVPSDPGTYQVYFVAHDGTTVGTSTLNITVQ